MPDHSGETNVPIEDWTTGTLKIYHDEKIAALKEYVEALRTDDQKAVGAALQAAKEAVLKAEIATEKRFESVNEFRKTLSDQTSSFLPRPEYDANHQALEDKIQALTDRVNTSEGQTQGSQITKGNLYAAVAAVGAILGILVLLSNNVFG